MQVKFEVQEDDNDGIMLDMETPPRAGELVDWYFDGPIPRGVYRVEHVRWSISIPMFAHCCLSRTSQVLRPLGWEAQVPAR